MTKIYCIYHIVLDKQISFKQRFQERTNALKSTSKSSFVDWIGFYIMTIISTRVYMKIYEFYIFSIKETGHVELLWKLRIEKNLREFETYKK